MPMVKKPNLQLVYVSDISKSTEFYKTLFSEEPIFFSPRYVAFSAGADALFALWTGGVQPDLDVPRYTEVGIMLESNEAVDALYAVWKKDCDLNIVQEPITEVFGRTFVVQDPDGHLIRVCPRD